MDAKKIEFLLLILINAFLTEALGANTSRIDALISTKNLNPYIPHTYLSGYSGEGASKWLGKVDILAPLLLREDRNLFVYGQGRYSGHTYYGDSQPYSASFGIGYRQIVESEDRIFYNEKLFTAADKSLLNDTRLFGMYLLADYANSPSGYKYWNLSPGFETLGEIDFRINGYIPFKKTHVETSSRTSRFSHFTAHDEYFKLYENYEEQGIGLDTEIGMKLFSIGQMPIKGYIDGYIFATENSGQIKGIGGRITIQPTRYLTLEFKNIYDNVQHNVFMGGMKFYLNGLTQGLDNTKVDNQGIKPRLYDPIERNFANIGNAATTPYAHGEKYYGTELNRSHIIFVRDPDINGLEGDGTYENPYVYGGSEKFQDLVDAAHTKFGDYSYLFLAPGVYDLGDTPISLHSYQLIFGRSDSFWEPAGSGEVNVIGSFYMQDAKHGGFRNFQLLNREGAFTYGIEINSTQSDATFVFDNVIIGEGSDGIDPTNNSFSTGVYIHDINTGSATFTINNSSFYGRSIGMWLNNENAIDSDTTFAIYASNFYAISNNSWPTGMVIYSGYEAGSININTIINSTFIGSDTGLGIYGGTAGLRIGDITNSVFDGYSDGLYIDVYTNLVIDNITYSTFNSSDNRDNWEWRVGYYIYSADITIGNIDNCTFTAHGRNGLAFWMIADNSLLNMYDIKHSTFKVYDDLYRDYAFDIWGPNIYIGNINDVVFDTGNGHSGRGIYIETNNAEIENIENSTFVTDGSYAINIYTFGGINISTINDSTFYANGESGNNLNFSNNYSDYENSINIGNIVNSTFNANGSNGSSIYVEGYSYYGFSISTDIANISNSIFSANGINGTTLNLKSVTTHINNIDSSSFFANGNNAKTMYFNPYHYSSSDLTIDNISNSYIEANGSNGIALYAKPYDEINIGNIQNSNFSANAIDTTGTDIWLDVTSVNYATTPYSNPEDLYTTLMNAGNTFDAIAAKTVCIGSTCYPT